MSDYYVSTESDLRTIVGYWDDSGGSRVAGTANTAGDRVFLPPETLTASGIDKVISLKSGVHLFGRSTASKLSGFGLRVDAGSGGTSVASALARFTLDINGLTETAAGASGAFGGFVAIDTSLVGYRFNITNSTPSAGGNNLTIQNASGGSAVQVLIDRCDFSNADLDCVSSKGAGSGANTSSVFRIFRSVAEEPGGGAANQAMTDHEGFPIHAYSCIISGSVAGAQLAWETATDGYEAQSSATNCVIKGGTRKLHTIKGCSIDLMGDTLRDYRVFHDSVVSGATEGPGNYCSYFGSVANPTGWSTTTEIRRISDVGVSSSTSLFAAGGCAVAFDIDGYVCTNRYRGLDLRSAGLASTVQNAVLEASQYGILHDGTPGLSPASTVTNVISDAAEFGGSLTGYTQDADIASEIAAQQDEAALLNADEPSVLDGWSNAVRSAYDTARLVCGEGRARGRGRLNRPF